MITKQKKNLSAYFIGYTVCRHEIAKCDISIMLLNIKRFTVMFSWDKDTNSNEMNI